MNRTQIFYSISEWLKAIASYRLAEAKILPDGTMVIKSNGQWFNKKEWEAANPKPVHEPKSGNDLNGESNGLLYGVKNSRK